MNLMLLAVLPFLSIEDTNKIRTTSETKDVVVLCVTENCAPCELLKKELDNKPNTYLLKDTDSLFIALNKGYIKKFPAIGVVRKSKVTIYQGLDNIRNYLKNRR